LYKGKIKGVFYKFPPYRRSVVISQSYRLQDFVARMFLQLSCMSMAFVTHVYGNCRKCL